MIFNITEWVNNNNINPENIQNYIIKVKSDDDNILYEEEIIGLGNFVYVNY